MTVNKGINIYLSLHRTVFLRVVPGGSVVSVPDSSLGRHRFQTSSQQPAAAHRLGTNHNSDGHQQVHASFSYLTFFFFLKRRARASRRLRLCSFYEWCGT